MRDLTDYGDQTYEPPGSPSYAGTEGSAEDPICPCCGQPEGRCPSCGREHEPAMPGRTREACCPEDEHGGTDEAARWMQQYREWEGRPAGADAAVHTPTEEDRDAE